MTGEEISAEPDSDASAVWRTAMLRMRNHLFAREIAPQEMRLKAYCLRLTRGDLSAAEDLLQETMLRGFSVCHVCGLPRDTRAYLFRTAANLWIDVVRRMQRDTVLARDLPIDNAVMAETSGALRWVKQLSEMLSAREFETLLLHKLHGYSCAEVADMLGTSEAAVKMASSRARRRARELFVCDGGFV